MQVRDVLSILSGIVVSSQANPDEEVHRGFSADLMSDVLRFGHEGGLLITGLTNPQVIRTAEMLGIRVLLFVRSKLPSADSVALAEEAGVTLLATRYTMYEASGLLYQAGLPGLGPGGEYTQTP
ncbi:MAG: hypothetical protein JW934_06720 [Anaerolineae bacterium]|nr:hypothetical protein [Anaerolineae bacterium]